MLGLFGRSGNLLQNPGFESGLTAWEIYNITIDDTTAAAEGTLAARLGVGESSLVQAVQLNPVDLRPLFVSFIAYMEMNFIYSAHLLVEVLWLDAQRNVIGTGLRSLLGRNAISNSRITYFDCTARPPLGALWAQLRLSKGAEISSHVCVDQLNLTPVESPNLVQNSSFERGLENWSADNLDVDFSLPWEGNAAAVLTGGTGTLFQNVPLSPLFPLSPYVLSFALHSAQSAMLRVQLLWLNAAGNPLGEPGIDLLLNSTVLPQQINYLSYLAISKSAPLGAVAARILFTVTASPDAVLHIDKVLLLRCTSINRVQNPDFADGLSDWVTKDVTVGIGAAYTGDSYANLAREGASLFQAVALPPASYNRFFLLSFAYLHGSATFFNGELQARLLWLDAKGNELGEGANIVALPFPSSQPQWMVYTAFTEKAPLGSVSAIIQFSKSEGFTSAPVGISHVLFARID